MGIKYREDEDIAFLQYCTEEDVRQLAEYLIYDKDGEERIASEISSNENFKLLYGQPDKWSKSWQLVAGELQHFGGDSIVNLFRGKGVLYKEILSDVCDKLSVKHSNNSSAYDIENLLIEKLTEMSWEKMSAKEKEKVLDSMNIPVGFTGSPLAFIVASIKDRGIGSFQWSSWLAQSASLTFGHTALSSLGLGAAATFIGSRGVAAFAGPLAAIVVTVPLISGAAYRITMPSVIQIAYLRRKYEQEDRF
jgi:uncharacterized protein YaaW (UPF0174 family)